MLRKVKSLLAVVALALIFLFALSFLSADTPDLIQTAKADCLTDCASTGNCTLGTRTECTLLICPDGTTQVCYKFFEPM